MAIGYTVVYEERVVQVDIPKIGKEVRKRIQRAIEVKLTLQPEMFGKPLRQSLAGYRKLRVGDYRVIFRIDTNVVRVFAIGHRRDVYQRTTKHLK